MNRLGNVDELNNIAVFLASDASTFMTGSDLVIDVCNIYTPLFRTKANSFQQGGYCAW